MAYKLMYIPNDDTQNYPFCRLKLVVEMFEHPTLYACDITTKIEKSAHNLFIYLHVETQPIWLVLLSTK